MVGGRRPGVGVRVWGLDAWRPGPDYLLSVVDAAGERVDRVGWDGRAVDQPTPRLPPGTFATGGRFRVVLAAGEGGRTLNAAGLAVDGAALTLRTGSYETVALDGGGYALAGLAVDVCNRGDAPALLAGATVAVGGRETGATPVGDPSAPAVLGPGERLTAPVRLPASRFTAGEYTVVFRARTPDGTPFAPARATVTVPGP